MKKVLKSNIEAGSRESNEPRLLGSIVSEMLHDNSPLAIGYRQYIASQENEEDEEQSWHANTDLGCNVKTLLRNDKRAKAGKSYPGVLRLDTDAEVDEFICRDPHYTFVETVPQTAIKRNPHVFDSMFVTITRRDDGSYRPNLKQMPKLGSNLSIDNYAFEVYRELRQGLKSLIEK
ncbi:hypothetical protein M1D30_06845 [Prevotella sp. E15-22]|uniref:hypothetical protein n=1 Tax=Prevotella sp. E15-22 TaxID=2937774 RepID=UPI00205E01CE|nr:hypothetical protein [Prevotella sp. E15-22]UPS43327.1 hypothetical protein M1D30_06845 [Prevotella sp. E15-22]